MIVEDQIMDDARSFIRGVHPIEMFLGIDDKPTGRVPLTIENQEGIKIRWMYDSDNVLKCPRKCAIPPTIALFSFLFREH